VPSRARIAFLLRDQARHCAAMGSPLYAHLLGRAAREAEDGGPVFDLLAPHDAPNPRSDALALRLMAGVHCLALGGEAPGLAAHYPSCGGTSGLAGAGEAFRAVLVEHADRLGPLLARPCQTNEVGRCAALAFGFLEVAARCERPLRLLEVGASAGLNLRFDRYRYGGGGATWGPPTSPVDLSGLWLEPPPRRPPALAVVERRGCDPWPVDPETPEGRLQLESWVWADQVARLERLRGAFRVAEAEPATVDRASADGWLPPALAERRAGVVSVVFHSIVEEYLSRRVRASVEETLARAGAATRNDTPLAYIRFEPLPETFAYGVTIRTWPGGEKRVVATAGAHGSDVRVAVH
jgi:hypothetical protein